MSERLDDDQLHQLRIGIGVASMEFTDALTKGDLLDAMAELREPMMRFAEATRTSGIPAHAAVSCLAGLAAYAIYGEDDDR